MDTLRLHEFVAIVKGTLAGPADADLQIQHAATHSGQIRSRSVFFALRGTRDGHDFVSAALANGAVAAVVAAGRRPGPDPASPAGPADPPGPAAGPTAPAGPPAGPPEPAGPAAGPPESPGPAVLIEVDD